METTSFFFSEGIADAAIFEDGEFDFNTQNLNSPGPDDEDENEDENQGEDENNNSGNDDPPIDEDVVHSPLPTQTGGKPKNSK